MQPVCIGLAECLPWGSQPPLLAGMRPDRGVMAVGNLPPIPLHCLSECVSGRVDIFVTAWESARLHINEQSWERAQDCILCHLI